MEPYIKHVENARKMRIEIPMIFKKLITNKRSENLFKKTTNCKLYKKMASSPKI
jgi:hypothetical protein